MTHHFYIYNLYNEFACTAQYKTLLRAELKCDLNIVRLFKISGRVKTILFNA